MTTAVPFSKSSPAPLAFDKALGLAFGWLCFSKKDGKPYVDAHGDHFPDDELVKAVDALMAKPAAEREINVEHEGPARGSIATAQALTEDVAKSLGADTAGTYGVIGSFRPDAALMKSILAGERFCLSIEGKAYDVEQVTKSADGAPAPDGCKRIMRNVELTKLAVVKAPAHEGASVTLIKSARAVVKAKVAKAEAAYTTADLGHQHGIADIDEPTGCTSPEQMPGAPDGGWHSHLWGRDANGSVVILMALGHTHQLASNSPGADSASTETPMADTEELEVGDAVTVKPGSEHMPEHAGVAMTVAEVDGSAIAVKLPDGTIHRWYVASELQPADTTETTAMADMTDTAKSLAAAQAALAKSEARLATLLSLPDEQRAFAKRLDGAALAAFLDAPDSERIAKSTPIYKAADGTAYFAAGEATLAKRLDEQAAEIAKANAQAESATFEKRAKDELGHTYGDTATHVAVLKAADGKALTADERAKVASWHKAVNTAYGSVFKTQGVNVTESPIAKSAQSELDAIAVDLQKQNPAWTFAKAQTEAMGTERGRQLYDAIEAAKRSPARA